MILTSFLSWTGLLLAAAVAFGGLQVDQAGTAPSHVAAASPVEAR